MQRTTNIASVGLEIRTPGFQSPSWENPGLTLGQSQSLMLAYFCEDWGVRESHAHQLDLTGGGGDGISNELINEDCKSYDRDCIEVTLYIKTVLHCSAVVS